MKYSFHPEADSELVAAIEYYEAHARGLGYDFSLEVYAAVERAAAYPELWPVFKVRYGVAWLDGFRLGYFMQ